jgi:hypothetical protein
MNSENSEKHSRKPVSALSFQDVMSYVDRTADHGAAKGRLAARMKTILRNLHVPN